MSDLKMFNYNPPPLQQIMYYSFIIRIKSIDESLKLNQQMWIGSLDPEDGVAKACFNARCLMPFREGDSSICRVSIFGNFQVILQINTCVPPSENTANSAHLVPHLVSFSAQVQASSRQSLMTFAD